jgi:hypothetical protein
MIYLLKMVIVHSYVSLPDGNGEILQVDMVIDLKVLVKSLNCEDRSCYVGNLRESFFSSSRK